LNIKWKSIDIKDLAAIVSEKLTEKGIDSLVVGGACVSIYTQNKYLSSDIDFVSHTPLNQITAALFELGFSKHQSRYFERKDCPFFLEFVSPPAAVGKEPIRSKAELPTKFGTISLFTATDCVKDRLAAFFHWNDPQAFEQACMVARDQKINIKEIERWALEEGHPENFPEFACSVFKEETVTHVFIVEARMVTTHRPISKKEQKHG
jgi:hypothetical protein